MAVGPSYASAGRARLGTIGEAKAAFFNSDAILKSMDRAANKALSKFGAYVRQSAKSSIRYRNDPSSPGQPPSAHKTVSRVKVNRKTGVARKQQSSPLRDLIFFYYDRATKRVIIGPTLFPSALRKGTLERLERGGSVQGRKRVPIPGRPERNKRGQFLPLDKRTHLVNATLHYPARPFMQPAFDKNIGQLTAFFKNSL